MVKSAFMKMDEKIDKIQDLFKTMAYGENMEDTSRANKWLQTMEIVDKSNDVESILRNVKKNSNNTQRSHFIKLAQELEKNVGIICQIEILSRGILSKDTKKAVDILAQYFYYYACLVDGKSKDIVIGVFEDDHPLWIIGLFLGPALAAGHTVVLQMGTKFTAVVSYVLELAVRVGINKDASIMIPSNEGDLQPYLNSEDVSVIALFIDLLDEKYQGVNSWNKKILIFSGYKTAMLIFDNADLDCAAENAIEAAWGYQGMLPWSLDTILVQENVFKTFTEKMKDKLHSVKIGIGDDKLADISYPSNPKVFQKLTNTIDKARALNIEIFQKETSIPNSFTPTLVIGSRVDTKNVLTPPENDSTVTILPFRSLDEAVNLANNTRQGLGAFVWSENIGLVNEVARKLKVANVWINSKDLFSTQLPLVPLKDSGVGYFGGRQGLMEYQTSRITTILPVIDKFTSFKTVDVVNSAIISGRNASSAWCKNSFLNRIKIFLQISDFIAADEFKIAETLLGESISDFITGLESLVLESREFGSSSQNGYNVTSLKGPRGVLVIEMRHSPNTHNTKLLLAALFEGNAVILLNESPQTQNFYQELSKKLPYGLLKVLPYSLDAVNTALNNRQLNGYFSSQNLVFGDLQLGDSKKFAWVTNDLEWEQIVNHVRVIKNIWSNIGYSSQCNL